MDVEQKKRREEVLLIGWELVLPELEERRNYRRPGQLGFTFINAICINGKFDLIYISIRLKRQMGSLLVYEKDSSV